MNYNIPIYLAPMAGVADEIFRTICSRYGNVNLFTEMISAKALTFNDKKTKTLFPSENEGKMIVQLFGHEPDIMANAAKMAEGYATEININMGCPMPKIAGNGDGSALMATPDLAKEMVKAAKSAVSVPVSVKFRKGIKEDTSVDFALAMESAGADKIYIHGRTKEQLYSGKADYETIKNVKNAVSIPVIGNGDIFTALDAERMIKETGVDGIMVGRGALGNPFIFRELTAYLNDGTLIPVATKEERIEIAIEHIALASKKSDGKRAILESRKHLAWYLKTIRGASKIRALLFTETQPQKIIELMKSLL